MDYGKSGNPKTGRKEPRPVFHGNKAKGEAAEGRTPKDELLARMKAAAEARKK